MRSDGRIEADYFTVEVEEGTATGSRIDCRIRLQEFLDTNGATQTHLPALPGAEDAVRHGLTETKGTADCQYPLTDACPITVAQCGGRDVVSAGQPQESDV